MVTNYVRIFSSIEYLAYARTREEMDFLYEIFNKYGIEYWWDRGIYYSIRQKVVITEEWTKGKKCSEILDAVAKKNDKWVFYSVYDLDRKLCKKIIKELEDGEYE